MFLFDEDMDWLASRGEPAPVIHIGRGGAGNWAAINPATTMTTTANANPNVDASAGDGLIDRHYDGSLSTTAASAARKSRDSGQSYTSAESSNPDSNGRCNRQGHGIWHRLGHPWFRS